MDHLLVGMAGGALVWLAFLPLQLWRDRGRAG